MRHQEDGLLLVRVDLCDRLDRLQRSARNLQVRDLAKDLAGFRVIASAYGLTPLVSLALAFERALLAQPRGCPAGLYLERLRDAIGCERCDDAASEALLASVSVRLDG